MASSELYTDAETVRGMVDKFLVDKDPIITQVISAISRAIDRKCNRPDGFVAAAVATTRLYAGSGSGWLAIDEAAAITSVGVKASSTDSTYTAWTADQWLAFGGSLDAPDFNNTPYTGLMAAAGTGLRFSSAWLSDEGSWPSGRRGMSSLRRRGAAPPMVQITARWGYALTVPPEIEQACIIESARLFKRGESGYADTLASMELGQLIQMAKLDPSTVFLLEQGRFIRPAV